MCIEGGMCFWCVGVQVTAFVISSQSHRLAGYTTSCISMECRPPLGCYGVRCALSLFAIENGYCEHQQRSDALPHFTTALYSRLLHTSACCCSRCQQLLLLHGVPY